MIKFESKISIEDTRTPTDALRALLDHVPRFGHTFDVADLRLLAAAEDLISYERRCQECDDDGKSFYRGYCSHCGEECSHCSRSKETCHFCSGTKVIRWARYDVYRYPAKRIIELLAEHRKKAAA